MISKGANRSRFELSLTVVRKKKSGFGSLVSLRRRSATAPRTEVVNIDTIVSYVKDRSDDTLLHISFGVPWYVNMREAIEQRHMVSKPRKLQFKTSEDRDDFCVSLVWSKKTNRDIFRKRHTEAMFNRLLSGGVGKVWFVGFNSTGRWQPHVLVWRLSSVTSDRGLVVVLRQRTNQDREVKAKFSSSRLVRIEQCPPESLPQRSTMPLDARPVCLVIEPNQAKARRHKFGVVFGNHETMIEFKLWCENRCKGISISRHI